MAAPFAEHVFVVQTLEPHILAEILQSRCYGITRKAFEEHLPQELLNVPEGSAAFIRLKTPQQSFLVGPVFTAAAPDGLAIEKRHGIWCLLDAHSTSARQPDFHDRFPCCFFFHAPDDRRFGILTEDDLQQETIHLPAWGVVPDGLGRKLIAMTSGRKQEAVEFLNSLGISLDSTGSPRVALTMPPHLKDAVRLPPDLTASTADALKSMLSRARRSIKIFSPYIDATFLNLIEGISVPIWIITTPHRHRTWKPNPVLERLATNQSVQIRYIAESRKGAHLFQLHAKMILCDRDTAYIGSANLTDTSIYYNIELGMMVADPETLSALDRLFEFLFANVGIRAEDLSRGR